VRLGELRSLRLVGEDENDGIAVLLWPRDLMGP
jgi:hypothetical protein